MCVGVEMRWVGRFCLMPGGTVGWGQRRRSGEEGGEGERPCLSSLLYNGSI